MMVFYRCEGEMHLKVQPIDLSDLLRNFIDSGMKSQQLKDITEDLGNWGAYSGTHDFGRFVIMTAPKMEETVQGLSLSIGRPR